MIPATRPVVSLLIWGKLVIEHGVCMALFFRRQSLSPSRIRRSPRALAALVSVVLPVVAVPELSQAQANLRSSFPGRRIGGGTRGECSARFLANLVPASSVFSPGAARLIGLLEGPTASPRPLQLSFAPYRPDAAPVTTGPGVSQRLLPASPASLVLISAPPIKAPTSWESTYRCPEGAAAGELDFVQSASPPAVSLLLPQAEAADQPIQAALQTLQKACGKSLSLAEIVAAFNLGDALGSGWPEQLPVRCL